MAARNAWGTLLIASAVFLASVAYADSDKPENGDGGPATEAIINGPAGLSIGANGNLYIIELEGRRVRMVDMSTGIIKTVAGDGRQCCFEEGARAVSTSLFAPVAIALDQSGNLYVADIGAHVRRIDAATGIATTIISDLTGSNADKAGVAPSLPKFEFVRGLAVHPSGTLYVVGSSHGQIYGVFHGVITVFAGVGERGYAGDGKPAREAKFNWPMEIALGPALDFYIADYENCRIRRIDFAPGIVSTVAGTGQCDTSGDGGKASAAAINHPTAVAVGGEGNIYFNDQSHACIRRIDVSTLLIRSVPNTCDIKSGKSEAPSGLAVDHQGNLYMSYFSSNVVRRVDAKTGVSKIVAGNGLPARIVRKVYSFPLQRRPWPLLPPSCPNEQLPKTPGEKPPSCE